MVFSLLLIVILALSSLIMVESASAQSIPKPSVPEFTVNFVDYSYNVPATQSVDPYTGDIVTHPERRVVNRTIEVSIKNQPFDSKLMYNIRVKGSFSEGWTEVFHPSDGFPLQSDSGYTVLLFSSREGDDFYYKSTSVIYAPAGGQVDFQVEAMNGKISRKIEVPVPGTGWIFTGEKSGWSNTQTTTNPASSTTSPTLPSDSSPTPYNSSPNMFLSDNTQLTIIAIIVAVLAVIIASLLLYIKVLKKTLFK
jgi:hypothetical protein